MTSKNTQDPGWNDPPIFTYDKATAIQAAAADRKRTPLNKRVAFPITGNLGSNVQANPTSNTDSSKPPPMSRPPLSSGSFITSTQSPQPQTEMSSTDRLEKVLQNLQIEGNCDEEIVKRIRIMENMWKDGKLGESVQSRIFELSEVLAKGDTETADHIQKGLMVDHVSQCSSWMSGIRHLINQKK